MKRTPHASDERESVLATASDAAADATDLEHEWATAHPIVSSFVHSVVRAHHDAEDLIQRTAMAVLAKFSEYQPDRPFVGWAIGVARIEILRFRQERARERLVFDEAAIDAVAAAYEGTHEKLRELREAVDLCRQKLRGRLRQVIERYFLRDVSAAEVATELGISENAVLVALHRARAILRDCMEAQAESER